MHTCPTLWNSLLRLCCSSLWGQPCYRHPLPMETTLFSPVMSSLLYSVLVKFTQECPLARELEAYRPLPAPVPPQPYSHTHQHIVQSVTWDTSALSGKKIESAPGSSPKPPQSQFPSSPPVFGDLEASIPPLGPLHSQATGFEDGPQSQGKVKEKSSWGQEAAGMAQAVT